MLLGKITSPYSKENKAVARKSISLFFFFFLFYSLPAKAHYPPQPGRIECGAIVGGVFYSEYYSPEGGGTPAVNGACSWVKQPGKSCGTYRYGGTNYTLYDYKYVCNVPLDNQVYVIAIGLTVFAFLRKRVFFTFS